MKNLSANSLSQRVARAIQRQVILVSLTLVVMLIAAVSPPSTSSPLGDATTLIAHAHADVTRSYTQVSRKTRRSRRIRRQSAYRSHSTHARSRPRYERPVSSYRRTRPSRPRPSVIGDQSTLLELGGTAYLPMVGVPLTGLSVGFGYRMMNLGVFGEAQFVQGPLGGELFDLNAQLRAYLPLAGQLELFPMVSLGASHLMQAERSDHLDIGVGAQLNLAPFMAVGARYQARVIGGQNNMSSPNGHQLTAQLSFSF